MITKESVTGVMLTGPSGESFQAESFSLSWTTGGSPGSVSVTLLSESRLKEAVAFDGGIVLEQLRGKGVILPKPGVGRELRSTGWSLTLQHPGDATTPVGPLILTEAAVDRASLAEGSLGKFKPDVGQERTEILKLTFSDTRLLWDDRGHLSGRRNAVDLETFSRVFRRDEQELKIPFTFPQFKESEETGEVTIEYAKPIIANIKIEAISNFFDPLSLLIKDGGESLQTMEDLLDEIASRLPLLVPWPHGGRIGYPSVLSFLKQLTPQNIDYEKRTSPKAALDKLTKSAGLVYGLTLSGQLFFDFEAEPLADVLTGAGVLAFQKKWDKEDRAYRPVARPGGYRFIPSRVIKEVVLHRFEKVVEKNGEYTEVNEFLSTHNLTTFQPKLDTIGFSIASKTETERPNEVDLLENRITGSGTSEDKENIQIVSTQAFRTFRYAPNPDEVKLIRETALTKRSELNADRRQKLDAAKFAAGLVKTNNLSLLRLDFEADAVADRLLRPPFDFVEKVDGLSIDLTPKAIADIPLHRTYDFIDMGRNIAVASFINPPTDTDTGHDPIFMGAMLTQYKYFVMNRKPVDFADANHKAETFQARWLKYLSLRNGNMTAKQIEKFWFDVSKFPFPPLGTFVVYLSKDATGHLRSGPNKEAVVKFREAVGIPAVSEFCRRILLQSKEHLLTQANVILPPILDPEPSENQVIFRLLAQKIETILSEDKKIDALIKKAIEPIDFAPFLQGNINFRGMLTEIEKRASGNNPYWQIASLKTSIEKDEENPGAEGLEGAGQDEEEQVDVPDGSEGDETGVGTVVVSKDVTNRVPVHQAEGSPRLLDGVVAIRAFVEAPFFEAAWPAFHLGSPPFTVVELKTPWIEDIDKNILSLGQLEAEIRAQLIEQTGPASLEETEEIQIPGLVYISLGGAIRSISMSMGSGGSSPRTTVSASRTVTKRFPVLRALQSISERALTR